MNQLPAFISVVFVLTTALSVFLFYRATSKSYIALVVMLGWLALQSIVASTGFYTVMTLPPRFPLLVGPALFCIILLFVIPKGRRFLDSLDEKKLILLHIVRIPVELVLLCLFLNKVVPQEMTFEGRNFDIFSGITAPVVYYFGYVKQKWSRTILLSWNFLCLGLLINVVVHAIFALPYPFQKIAFNQPN
ncbi:MAG TPA: hypothetical protein VFF27_05850, partial [Bacteroidia bacterium]|nr:hypothetical protein [Bacteroidia bacterium]